MGKIREHFTVKDVWMVTEYMTRYSTSLNIREMQIKMARYHYMSL